MTFSGYYNKDGKVFTKRFEAIGWSHAEEVAEGLGLYGVAQLVMEIPVKDGRAQWDKALNYENLN